MPRKSVVGSAVGAAVLLLTVAAAALQAQGNGNWTLVAAATTFSLLPLLVLRLVLQGQIVRSITITGFR